MSNQNKTAFLECKDHTVSGEKFLLYVDDAFDMLITSPKPNTKELSKYYESEDYISHTDAKRSWFEKTYHLVKRYALAKKVKLIVKLKPDVGQLLDIGAGTGDFLAAAKRGGWDVSGTEPNLRALQVAQEKGVSLETETTNYESGIFDVITMWHVLEHVPDLEKQLRELKRLLKPEGIILIAVPNFKSYDAKHYGAFWAAYDVPRHLWHFSKYAVEKLFLKYDIELEQIVPMRFDAYYVSLLSEKHKTGKMNFAKAFWIGFLSNIHGKQKKEYSSHIYVLKNTKKSN